MEEIRNKYDKLSSSLNTSVSDLRSDKTDRVTLANLLTEVALRLKEEFTLPEVE